MQMLGSRSGGASYEPTDKDGEYNSANFSDKPTGQSKKSDRFDDLEDDIPF